MPRHLLDIMHSITELTLTYFNSILLRGVGFFSKMTSVEMQGPLSDLSMAGTLDHNRSLQLKRERKNEDGYDNFSRPSTRFHVLKLPLLMCRRTVSILLSSQRYAFKVATQVLPNSTLCRRKSSHPEQLFMPQPPDRPRPFAKPPPFFSVLAPASIARTSTLGCGCHIPSSAGPSTDRPARPRPL